MVAHEVVRIGTQVGSQTISFSQSFVQFKIPLWMLFATNYWVVNSV